MLCSPGPPKSKQGPTRGNAQGDEKPSVENYDEVIEEAVICYGSIRDGDLRIY